MACEYLLGGNYPLCLVVQGLLTPSLSEMRTYCASDHWSQCPLYEQHAATHEKVPLDAATVLLDASAGAVFRKAALRKPSLPVETRTMATPFPHRRPRGTASGGGR
jgi:hypothetical protein